MGKRNKLEEGVGLSDRKTGEWDDQLYEGLNCCAPLRLIR